MFNFLKIIYPLFFAGLLMLTSCTKEGAVGPQGATGPQGAAGTPGNANVKSSTATISSWLSLNNQYYADIAVPAITQDIVNKGAVLVYRLSSTGSYSQLPLTIFPGTTYNRTIEAVHSVGSVRIFVYDSDGTLPGAQGTQDFKIVVIASSARTANPNLNWNNYEAVKTHFNLD